MHTRKGGTLENEHFVCYSKGRYHTYFFYIYIMLKYHPYKSDKPEKKYYIITNSGRKIYFGAAGMSDFTKHKDEARKQRYINRHKNNENWGKSGIDTAGFWSRWLLWNKPTIKESYDDIKRRFL
jgi:hypothetical protein